MDADLTPTELDEILGAYALDALDPDERAAVEAWIARVPNARREADELRETASLLAQATEEPPADLWARIETGLAAPSDGAAPPPPLGAVVPIGARPRGRAGGGRAPTDGRQRWAVGVAAALALAVAVGVGVVVGRQVSEQDARIDRLAAGIRDDGLEKAALAAAMAPGSRTARLAAPDGSVMAEVVTTADGRGYFVAEALPRLPSGRTYQLWALMSEDATSSALSVGVLGRSPTVMAFSTDAGVMGFAVTEEASPGVPVSEGPVRVEGWLA